MRQPASGPDRVFGTSERRRLLWPWLALLVVSGAITSGIAWEVWPRAVDLSVLRPRSQGRQAKAPVTAEQVRARLFFPHETKTTLVEEERDLPPAPAFVDAVRGVLQELTRPTVGGAVLALPPTAEIRQVFLDGFGILYLDFGNGIQALVSGDPLRVDLAISSIVLTLTTNFSEVKRVQFLAEGHELTAQIGTVDLRRPLQPRFPGEEAEPTIIAPPEGAS